jgi:hypothetical protein
MRTASADLQTLLASRLFLTADCYTFTLPSGTVLKYTSFDTNVGAFATGVGFERSTAKWSTGLQVDTMDVTLHARPDQTVDGTPIIEAIAAGDWDGAQATVERAFMPLSTPGIQTGTILIFSGWFGEIAEVGRIHAKIQLQSKMALLNTALPKALYQPGCRHVLFDSGCTLNRADFTTAGTVGAGSTTSTINTGTTPVAILPGPVDAPTISSASATGVLLPVPARYFATATYTTAYGETTASPESQLLLTSGQGNHLVHVASPPSVSGATGWNVYMSLDTGDEQLQNTIPLAIGSNFVMPAAGLYLSGQRTPTATSQGFFAQGVITFTSGLNVGRRRAIESNTGGTITLRVPLPIAPEAGDAFNMTPGCDHTMATCLNKFSNLAHYGGFNFIPVPEVGSA